MSVNPLKRQCFNRYFSIDVNLFAFCTDLIRSNLGGGILSNYSSIAKIGAGGFADNYSSSLLILTSSATALLVCLTLTLKFIFFIEGFVDLKVSSIVDSNFDSAAAVRGGFLIYTAR